MRDRKKSEQRHKDRQPKQRTEEKTDRAVMHSDDNFGDKPEEFPKSGISQSFEFSLDMNIKSNLSE